MSDCARQNLVKRTRHASALHYIPQENQPRDCVCPLRQGPPTINKYGRSQHQVWSSRKEQPPAPWKQAARGCHGPGYAWPANQM